MHSDSLQTVLRAAAESMFPAEEEISIDVNSRAPDGDTPLHLFAWRGDVESARVLVSAGADVNALGDMSETPLHIALRKENEQLVILLLAARAKITLRSEFGDTAQDIARRIGGRCAELFANRRSRRQAIRGGA